MIPLEGEAPHVEVLTEEELLEMENDEEVMRIKKCILGIFFNCINVHSLCRLVSAGLSAIHAHFANLEGESMKETLAVSSIMLLHIAIPIITTRSVKEMGKDRPSLADFCTKVARIIMKLSSHTYFGSGEMMKYNNLIHHLEVPFQRFCSDVCYEGKDYEAHDEVPNQKVFFRLKANLEAVVSNPKHSAEISEIQSEIKVLLEQIAVVMEKGVHMTEKVLTTGSDLSASGSELSLEDWKAPATLPDYFDTTATLTDHDAPTASLKKAEPAPDAEHHE